MLDYLRRFLIVMAVALSIGILFIGATVASAETEKTQVTDFIWPTIGSVSDTFGTRGGKHYGIDIAASKGTEVVSVSDGNVIKSYYSNTYGNVVFIKHNNGYETVSAHLHERNVDEGDFVYQGEQIGIVGNTGRSSGAHLHFEIHDGDWTTAKKNAIDPFLVIGNNRDSFFVLGEVENQNYQVASATSMESYEDDEYLLVKVKKGDSLWSVANSYQVTVSDLMTWNELDSEKIFANQQLKIRSGLKYIVQSGDTLSRIAEQSGSSVAKIRKINGIKGDTIQVGTILIIY